jgi:hypothetical protein
MDDPNIKGMYFWAWSYPVYQPNNLPAAQTLLYWYSKCPADSEQEIHPTLGDEHTQNVEANPEEQKGLVGTIQREQLDHPVNQTKTGDNEPVLTSSAEASTSSFE